MRGKWVGCRKIESSVFSWCDPMDCSVCSIAMTLDAPNGKGDCMRIVSLLPSATEIVCGLGLRQSLVGVTHECDWPVSVSELPKVTRSRIPADATSGEIDALVREQTESELALYSLDQYVLGSLEPDLIITQSLCDVCAVAESEVETAVASLAKKPKVINLNPTSLEDVFGDILKVGESTNCVTAAREYVDELRGRVEAVGNLACRHDPPPTVILLEWIDPLFSAGHWNPELVKIAGGREWIGRSGERSQTIQWETVIHVNPEIMIIACCGYDVQRAMQDLPLLQSYPGWSELECVKSGRVYVTDGSAYFNRPGPRLVDSLESLALVINADTRELSHDQSQSLVQIRADSVRTA